MGSQPEAIAGVRRGSGAERNHSSLSETIEHVYLAAATAGPRRLSVLRLTRAMPGDAAAEEELHKFQISDGYVAMGRRFAGEHSAALGTRRHHSLAWGLG